tara:strand:- start:4558 stop:4953 length:396 start_codon:yes stop_codon:yes gene_type:complete
MEKIYSSIDVFKKLMAQELPLNVSYQFTQLLKNLNTHFNVLETTRLELVKKFGEKQENGETRVVGDDDKKSFLDEFNELLSKEVEIDWEPISLETMGNKVTLTIPDLNRISFLFTDFATEAKENKEETVSA